jgi:hypothetical protein
MRSDSTSNVRQDWRRALPPKCKEPVGPCFAPPVKSEEFPSETDPAPRVHRKLLTPAEICKMRGQFRLHLESLEPGRPISERPVEIRPTRRRSGDLWRGMAIGIATTAEDETSDILLPARKDSMSHRASAPVLTPTFRALRSNASFVDPRIFRVINESNRSDAVLPGAAGIIPDGEASLLP